MKRFKVKRTVLLLCLCIGLPLYAQTSIKETLSRLTAQPLPYTAAKGIGISTSFGIANPNNVMQGKLYKNFQCTDYYLASTYSELNPAIHAKFAVPETDFVIGAVDFGGATDDRTVVLIVVDNAGSIKSTLEAEVRCGWVAAKQFRITKDGKVIVSKLVPTTSGSVLFDTFTQLTAKRVDEIYFINLSGIFIKEGEVEYGQKVYTRSELDTESFNIWN